MIAAPEPTTETSQPSTVVKIVVIDSQRSYVDALGLALELTSDLRIVAQEPDIEQGIEVVRQLEPDLIITASLPRTTFDGLDFVTDLHRPSTPPAPVVYLTAHPTPGLEASAREHKHVSVLSKQVPVTDLVRSFRSILAGEQVFVGIPTDPFRLSPAEFEVLEYLVNGQSAAQIADDMHLSIHAIRARIRSLLAKTSSRSQLEAVSKAISAGVASPPPARALGRP